KLVTDLKGKIAEIRRGKIRRIGIVIDQDTHSQQNRLDFLNEAIAVAYGQNNVLQAVNQLFSVDLDEDTTVEIACHLMNVKGAGELETVLKAIKTLPAPNADCLETWRACVEAKGQTVKEKEFVKSWIQNYIRLDSCISSKFRGNKNKYCSMRGLDQILARTGAKVTFDLNHAILGDLKTFLRLFPS
ncbi:MAG: DUF3226 domain-containing protein, partial [Aureispira sp.]